MIRINKDFKRVEDYDAWDANMFEVGQILDASFVYSAKIPKFFKITRRTKSTIWAVEIGQKVVSHDGYGQNGEVMPIEDDIVSNKEVSGRIVQRNGKGYLKLNNSTAHVWDGEPVDFYTD